MEVMILHSSPNLNGLTAACARAAAEGVESAGGHAEIIRLNDLDIGLCEACDNGWGICRKEHRCILDADFPALHERFVAAEAYVLVTPVYYGDSSESMKAFTDRVRRCEATKREASSVEGKPVLLTATAGGGGGGAITCLHNLERWVQHVRARRFDTIAVRRWTRPYQLDAIREAAKRMVHIGQPDH